MNIHRHTLSALLLLPSLCLGQGSLTPPAGPPAPMMKTLDQIESRTPVNKLSGDATAAHIITLPGSYYLTGPVIAPSGKSGIRIEATNVTLDLNGFSLEGVAGSKEGIRLTAAGGHVAIRNGMLRFWTTGGILAPNISHVSVSDVAIFFTSEGPGLYTGDLSRAERVRVNGARRSGIRLGDAGGTANDCVVEGLDGTPVPEFVNLGGPVFITAATVTGCAVRNYTGGNTSYSPTGIVAGIVDRCVVSSINTGALSVTGIEAATVRQCEVKELESTAGVSAIRGQIISGNVIANLSGTPGVGIDAVSNYASVSSNTLRDCSLRAATLSTVTGNSISTSGQDSIVISGAGSRVTGNSVTASSVAATGQACIRIQGVRNVVENNSFFPAAGNYGVRVLTAGNTVSGNTIAAHESGTTGISLGAGVTGCRIEANSIALTGGSGILAATGASGATNNTIVRNSVSGATTAYSLGTGNQAGPVVSSDTLDTTVSPWANLSQP